MVFIKKHVKLILVLTTVLAYSTWYFVKRENNDYFTHFDAIAKKFIYEMEEKHRFSCLGIGGSRARKIKEVSFKFNCYEKKSIEEARKLEVECIERFCEMINSHKKIRPHLEEFPFPSERVEVMICFCEKGLKCFPPEESIGLVRSCREKLIYEVVFTDFHLDQTVFEETYSEAYEKVKGISSDGQQVTLQSKHQSQSSKNNNSLSQGSNPSIFDDEQQEALRREFEKLEKDYGFYKKAR